MGRRTTRCWGYKRNVSEYCDGCKWLAKYGLFDCKADSYSHRNYPCTTRNPARARAPKQGTPAQAKSTIPQEKKSLEIATASAADAGASTSTPNASMSASSSSSSSSSSNAAASESTIGAATSSDRANDTECHSVGNDRLIALAQRVATGDVDAESFRLAISSTQVGPKNVKRKSKGMERFTYESGQIPTSTRARKSARKRTDVSRLVSEQPQLPAIEVEEINEICMDFPWLAGSCSTGTLGWHEAAQLGLAELILTGTINLHTPLTVVYSSGSNDLKWAMEVMDLDTEDRVAELGNFCKEVRKNREQIEVAVELICEKMNLPESRTICKALWAAKFLEQLYEANPTATPVLVPTNCVVVKKRIFEKLEENNAKLLEIERSSSKRKK